VAVDGNGRIIVADSSNHRIRVIDKGQVTTLAGTGQAGFADGPAAAAQFNSPADVAVDSGGKIIVADRSNRRIRVIDQGQVATLAGTGQAGFADGPASTATFNGPTGVAVDANGRVIVADRSSHSIRVIDKGQVTTLAGTGQAGHADGPAATALFNQPTGVAVDGSGKIVVADRMNHCIRVIDTALQVNTLAGTPGVAGYADGPSLSASFNGPAGLAMDPAGGLVYVADTDNNRIRVIGEP
jgi:DNA-binding beta-propeller fold protein YncE